MKTKLEKALEKARKGPLPDSHQFSSPILPAGRGKTSDLSLYQEETTVSANVLHELKIIHGDTEKSAILNEFRALRTTVLQKLQRSNISLLVFSLRRGGGASYTAINLASSISLEYDKTSLIVSCDIYHPPAYETLIENDKTNGLVEFLTGNVEIDKIIYRSGIKWLRIIPSGSPDSSFTDYFTSSRLNYFFSEIQSRYDDRIVIIDGPSAENVADLKQIANNVDAAILVVPYGKCTVDEITDACQIVGSKKLLGVTINNIPDLPV